MQTQNEWVLLLFLQNRINMADISGYAFYFIGDLLFSTLKLYKSKKWEASKQ